MFDSLLKGKINWSIFIVVTGIIFLTPSLNIFAKFGLIITLHQFLLLYSSVNSILPIRYLFGFLMCIQMLFGPLLVYNWFSEYQSEIYRMQIPQEDYLSYTLPVVICFLLGLHYNAGSYQGEVLNQEGLKEFIGKYPQLPYILIIVGFAGTILFALLPVYYGFIFTLVEDLKYIGVFILIIVEKKLKPWPIVLVFGSIISTSLSQGLFHDLITWVLFLGAIFCIKNKPNDLTKIISTIVFLLLILILQEIKGSYRNAIYHKGQETGLGTITDTYKEQQGAGIFTDESIGPTLVRINQGFILSYIMKNVPENIPFQNGGEMLEVLEAAIMPRVVDPNKLKAGDRQLFTQYSGLQLSESTSMALGSPGDAYVNFGIVGGIVFMFFLGLTYNTILKYFEKYKTTFPLIIVLSPLVFYYPIRPDCELQTILGHLFKSIFFLYIITFLFKKYISKKSDTQSS